MTTKATLAGLQKYINDQPADRPVNHSSWAACAVGDYARSLGETVFDTRGSRGNFELLYTDPVVKGLWNQAGTCNGGIAEAFEDTPINAPSLMDVLSENCLPLTYGELSTHIADRLS